MMRTEGSNHIVAALVTVLVFILPTVLQAAGQQEDNSCIACHGELGEERLHQPVALWSGSVHAKVGNTCDGCHGGDPKDPTLEAMSKANRFRGVPSQAQVTNLCATCHPQTAESYKTSMHFQIGQPTCIDCHSPHAIRRSADEIITPQQCSVCHKFAPAEKFKTILTGLSARLQKTHRRIAAIRGLPTQPFEQQQADALQEFQNVRRVSHTLNREKLEEEAGDANQKLDVLTGDIDRLEALSQDRKHLGLAAIALFLALTVITYFYNEQNKKDEGRGD